MILAAAGLMSGRRAITHADAVEELQASGAQIVEARVVDDGDVVSAAWRDLRHLALHLVQRLAGPEIRRATETEIEYEGAPAATRALVRAPFTVKSQPGRSGRRLRACHTDDCGTEDLARRGPDIAARIVSDSGARLDEARERRAPPSSTRNQALIPRRSRHTQPRQPLPRTGRRQ
jgi:DJ-1/PfpI family